MKMFILAGLVPLMLGGCLSTAASIVTAPVRVGAKVVDWTTTSRDEADRGRGRKLRRAEERARRECRSVGDKRAQSDCVHARLMDEKIL